MWQEQNVDTFLEVGKNNARHDQAYLRIIGGRNSCIHRCRDVIAGSCGSGESAGFRPRTVKRTLWQLSPILALLRKHRNSPEWLVISLSLPIDLVCAVQKIRFGEQTDFVIPDSCVCRRSLKPRRCAQLIRILCFQSCQL